MKNNLTIIIPLYERVENTEIFLKNNIYSEYNYFFCDGGYSNEHQKKFSSIHSQNIYYKKFTTDTILPYDIVKKIISSLEMINTEYVMLVDNDDFLNFYGINKCLNYLKNNNDFDFTGGDTLFIRTSRIQNKYHLTPGKKNSKIYDSKKGKKNVVNYFSKKKFNDIVYYSIFKKDFLVTILNKLINTKNISLYHFEIFFNVLAIFYGKFKYIECNHYIRLHNASGSLNAKIKKDFKILFEEEQFKKSLNSLKLLLKNLNFLDDEANELINNYYIGKVKEKKDKLKIIKKRIINFIIVLFYLYPLSITSLINKINIFKK